MPRTLDLALLEYPYRTRHAGLTTILGIALIGTLATAVGVGSATSPWATAVGVSAAGVIVVACTGRRQRSVVFYGLLAAIPLISGLATYGQLGAHDLRLLSDLALALGFVPLVAELSRAQRSTQDLALLIFILLVAGESVGYIRSHGGLSMAGAAAWQDLRWPGAIGWGLYLGRDLTARGRARRAYHLLIAWNAVQVTVAAGQMLSGVGSETRFSLPVVTGAFGHPTLGAVVGTMLFTLVIADALSPSKRLSSRQRMIGVGLAMATLIVSTRLKPLLALVGLLVYVIAARRFRKALLVSVVTVAVPLVAFLALPIARSLSVTTAEASNSLVGNIAGHAGPRATLLTGAETLAASQFPVGWGLGTFGSNVSPSIEDGSFAAARLDTTFGFSGIQPSFRFDSVMAHVLGERGWLGLLLWVVALVLTLTLITLSSPRYLFPAGALAVAVALTPISPSMQDPTIALVMFLPLGLCVDLRRVPSLQALTSSRRSSGRCDAPTADRCTR